MSQADAVLVTVTRVQGSAPREEGAWMRVMTSGQSGSIGGGALEYEAARLARKMRADGTTTMTRVFPLGPDLGQCCGGAVTLEFEADAHAVALPQKPLWIWGAGHVGRAIAEVTAPLGQHQITVVDTTEQRMPALPEGVTPLVAADPLRVVRHAPLNATHLIMTYAHDIDLALCDALLRHGFAGCGLIGSATKWTRFRKRLHAMGQSEAAISRITCPIGDPTLGKHPQAIAIGVACGFLSHRAMAGGSQ